MFALIKILEYENNPCNSGLPLVGLGSFAMQRSIKGAEMKIECHAKLDMTPDFSQEVFSSRFRKF
jgi:hypothetical protein